MKLQVTLDVDDLKGLDDLQEELEAEAREGLAVSLDDVELTSTNLREFICERLLPFLQKLLKVLEKVTKIVRKLKWLPGLGKAYDILKVASDALGKAVKALEKFCESS